MAHQRQLIRTAAAAALLNRTAAEERVYATREAPFKRCELPALAVYTLEESVLPDSRSTAPRELTRNLQLAVVGVVELNEKVDDAVDELALEVERAMARDAWLGDTCVDSILASTEIGIDEAAKRPTGMVRLVYSVTYRTYAPEAEDTPLDDFRTADVRTNLGGAVNPTNEAEDLVQVQES